MKNVDICRVFSSVSNILYGNGTFANIHMLLPDDLTSGVLIVKDTKVKSKIEIGAKLHFVDYNFDELGEPKSDVVNSIFAKCRNHLPMPAAVIAIGGGSVMDVGKALAIMYKNIGLPSIEKVQDLQGWDRVQQKGIFKIGVPTVFGSGSEASRTAVLKMDDRKLGINSKYSQFDAILIDPEFSQTVEKNQAFFSAMDCFIHSVESLEGCYKNTLALAYANMALGLSKSFLKTQQNDEDIAIASYFGGVSIVNSEVGICHALSYGLSKIFEINHGEANCIIFPHLEEFYGQHCEDFLVFRDSWGIKTTKIPALQPDDLDEMIRIALTMERPLENALGPDYKSLDLKGIFTEIYKKL